MDVQGEDIKLSLEQKRTNNIIRNTIFLSKLLGKAEQSECIEDISQNNFQVTQYCSEKSKVRKCSSERAEIHYPKTLEIRKLPGSSRVFAVVRRIVSGPFHKAAPLTDICSDPTCDSDHFYLVEWAFYQSSNQAPMPTILHESELLKSSGNLLHAYIKGQFSNLCDRCRNVGHLRCCGGGCLRAFHDSCLLSDEKEDLDTESWACPVCKFGVESKVLPNFLFDGYQESMRSKRLQSSAHKRKRIEDEQFAERQPAPQSTPFKRSIKSNGSTSRPHQARKPSYSVDSDAEIINGTKHKQSTTLQLQMMKSLLTNFTPAHLSPPGTQVFVRSGPQSPDFVLAQVLEQDMVHGKMLVVLDFNQRKWIPSTVYNFMSISGKKRNAKIEGISKMARQATQALHSSNPKPELFADRARRQLLACFPHGMWDPQAHQDIIQAGQYRVNWDSELDKAILEPITERSSSNTKLSVLKPGQCIYISKDLAVIDLVLLRQREQRLSQAQGDHPLMVGMFTTISLVSNQLQDEHTERLVLTDRNSYEKGFSLLSENCNGKPTVLIEIEVMWLERGEDLEINDHRAAPLDFQGVPLGGAQCQNSEDRGMLYLTPRRNWIPLVTVLTKFPEVRYIPPSKEWSQPKKGLSTWRQDIQAWTSSNSDRLFFSHMLRCEEGCVTFDTPVEADFEDFIRLQNSTVTSEGVKNLKLTKSNLIKPSNPSLSQLKVLDLFCGVGGTSLGFIGKAAGCSKADETEMKNLVQIVGAVDSCPRACKAYARNIPHSKIFKPAVPVDQVGKGSEQQGSAPKKNVVKGQAPSLDQHSPAGCVPVFQMDIEQFLEALKEKDMKGKDPALQMVGQFRKNNPDLIVVTAPCQNFSGLNRSNDEKRYHEHHSNNKALWQGWEVIGMLRPKGVLMENVLGLVGFKDNKGSLLGRMIGQLLCWGYNVRIQVMMVHQYGVPSRRQRLILQATLPGISLPNEPTKISASGWEVFKDMKCQSYKCIHRSSKQTTDQLPWEVHEDNPFFAMPVFTVRDAISDLARIAPMVAGDSYDKPLSMPPPKPTRKAVEYESYQKMARLGSREGELYDHVVCNINDKNKSGWKRMSWDEIGPTITGTLDPTLYRFAHPDHDRVFSVREGARIQSSCLEKDPVLEKEQLINRANPSDGFRDQSRFAGSINERYKQLANAVPPPLAFRLAQEWTKQLCKKQRK